MIQRFEEFVSLINTAYKGLQKVKSIQMEGLGLRGSHVMCLFYLGTSKEGLTNIELCDKCREDKAAISRTLKHLSDMGYVKTSDSEDKKYKLRNVLTDKGKTAYMEIERLAVNAVAEFGAGLTEEERNIFYKALGVIVTNFDEYCKTIEVKN